MIIIPTPISGTIIFLGVSSKRNKYLYQLNELLFLSRILRYVVAFNRTKVGKISNVRYLTVKANEIATGSVPRIPDTTPKNSVVRIAYKPGDAI